MEYIKARLKERDTITVIGAAAYTVAAALIPPEYKLAVDIIAGVLGFHVAATPNR